MDGKSGNRIAVLAACILAAAGQTALGGTFGKVVAIGGHAADIALDEARGVLYVANFTANRVEVMSAADGSIQTSINVSSQPASLALSPDGRHLVVGHYGNFVSPNSPANAITVIDLNTRGRQTFALGFAPLGIAFGLDGRALVVTNTDFNLFDPVTGVSQALTTIEGLAVKTLPQPPVNFPPNIVSASIAASADGKHIFGLTDTFNFSYDVINRRVAIRGYTSSPPMGPRVVSVARDGSYYLSGWVLRSATGVNLAQFPDATGDFHVGSHAIDSEGGVAYAQVPKRSGQTTQGSGGSVAPPPILQVLDADNLRVRQEIRLPENLAGKSLLSADASVMYAISESGLTILPVGALHRAPRVTASQSDLAFRGNFCDRRTARQELAILDPGGSSADFTIRSSNAGVRVSPPSGRTPAVVEVQVDPNTFENSKGTVVAELTILTAAGVNVPRPVRVLINNREPDQRGTSVNVPGKLVDILPDPVRDRFYVLRQDANEVLVYDGSSYALIKTLRTGNTPWSMAITFDRRYLLVGNDNSQIANVYDLETLEADAPIIFPGGHYPRWIAASGKAILAACRVAGETQTIDRVDMSSRRAYELPTLGVYENTIDPDTAMVASPNGAGILIAQANGNVLFYDANVDTFTVSRKLPFTEANKAGGSLAASSYDRYVVGNFLLNSSLVPVMDLSDGTGAPSGFAFVDQSGLRSTALEGPNPGIIQRVDPGAGRGTRSTRMIEAPLLGGLNRAFLRTMAPLYSRNVIMNLTTSGFTVLPWNFDASVAPPRIDSVVNAADSSPALAPGSLITIRGDNLSPVNLATRELPLPTALGESCLTVNGVPTPVMFVSSSQINAQMPFNVDGSVTMVLRTPGGVSDNFNLQVRPGAPGVFRSGTAGQETGIATVVRVKNGEIVTLSNPIHRGDRIVIYLTGLGRTLPSIDAGVPAPSDPPILTLAEPEVDLGGVGLPISFAGLSPGQVGVYQINAEVPGWVPKGIDQPLTINQAGSSTTVAVRVVD